MSAQRIALIFMLFIVLVCYCGQAAAASAVTSTTSRISYDIKWLDTRDESLIPKLANEPGGWTGVSPISGQPFNHEDKYSFLVRITLPKIANGSGILFDELTGLRFKLMKRDIVLYDYTAHGRYPYHRILVPLHPSDSNQTLYLYGKTTNRAISIGIGQAPLVGPYDELSSRYTRADISSMTLGVTLLFVATVMLICSIFLTREQLRNWLSLSIIVMAIGMLIVLSCPFPYLFFSDFTAFYDVLYDTALYVCLPVTVYFFEQWLNSRWRRLIRYWRYVVTLCSAVSLVAAFLNEWTAGRISGEYICLKGDLRDVLLIVSVVVITLHVLRSAWERNKEAIVICIGIAVALAVAVAEFCWLFEQFGPSPFELWEWPLTGFIFHLIVLLSKRYVNEHAQAASYLRELEMYQQQLMVSTQMEAASQLAASVAHEVRNPLSVTRGFVQLLRHRTASEAEPLQEALEELDHAHDVITNYLKYAKPEADDIDLLNVQELLKETITILNPLLVAQRVEVECHSEGTLLIRGRASHLKQALITILMQRIHSLEGQGRIVMHVYADDGQAVIRMTDDAKPFITTPLLMPDVPLANLMTDAGLIFALRSIESMNGKLIVKKRKGGSELIIRVPIAPILE
ncbi:sensor histidine kinase [Paenibacillus kobensis]|uniref:sensor histidine kinase n=1 Tax=Paenibacillus kobensis TaxID=59841 RepID=UPI000FD72390|nr:HAMP domain-containing sensor histidine kinase [Paenibacillus kobensis]